MGLVHVTAMTCAGGRKPATCDCDVCDCDVCDCDVCDCDVCDCDVCDCDVFVGGRQPYRRTRVPGRLGGGDGAGPRQAKLTGSGCVREERGRRLEVSRGRDGGQAGSREWKHDYSREQRVEALVEQREGGHKTGPEWRHQSTSTHQSPSPLVPWSTSPLLP
jgi:hypothetical protein